ncbi:MAG: hypothetical protein ACXITV_10925 [Luteibaculaceae bacterium]
MIKFRYLAFAISLFAFGFSDLKAQDGSALATEKEGKREIIRFNGQGRTLLNQTEIGGNRVANDTTNASTRTDGEFQLDLQINASPNDKTEVQSILRLRNQFGGFFGAGMAVEVRELWTKGIIGDVVEYTVGDMDLVMSEYTLFNFDEEMRNNEAAIFAPQRELLYYEEFYHGGNTRRFQGGKVNFGLNFARVLDEADFMGFIARVRGTDFFSIPSRFVSGGSVRFSTESLNDSLKIKGNFGLNLVHTFDDLKSAANNAGIRNTVVSGTWNISAMQTKDYGLFFVGEGGRSMLTSLANEQTVYESNDVFLDAGVQFTMKPKKLKFAAKFVDIGPEFFSIAAQSRRINLESNRQFFNRVGNEQELRAANLFDISQDRNLYTFQLSDRLMEYDPRFSNALPFGSATPNRRGAKMGAEFGETVDKIEARLDAAFLSEIKGQGTPELKNFTLVRTAANINLHSFFNWENQFRITTGWQIENTTRGGNEIERINLTSNLIDLGVESELFKNFHFLVGVKQLIAKGNEFVPRIDEFNIIADFPMQFRANDRETLFATGFRYDFKDGVNITFQYQNFTLSRLDDSSQNFRFDQFFLLYTMNF